MFLFSPYLFRFHFINRFAANPKIFVRQFLDCSYEEFLWYIHNFRGNFAPYVPANIHIPSE